MQCWLQMWNIIQQTFYEFEKEDVGVKFDYNDAEEAEAYVDEG